MPRIRLPNPTTLQPIQYKKPKDFTDEIIAIEGVSPLAQAVSEFGKVGAEGIKAYGKVQKDNKSMAEAQATARRLGLAEDMIKGIKPADAEPLRVIERNRALQTQEDRDAAKLRNELTRSEIAKNLREPLPPAPPKPPAPPPGYVVTPEGNLAVWKGGPVETKEKEAKVQKQAEAETQKREATNIISKIDSAIKNVSHKSAGFGAYTKHIPGSPAMTLSNDLASIESSLGLDKLMEMKANSKAGASGLGALSDMEMQLLVKSIASLKQEQNPDQLIPRLNEVKTHYQNVLQMNEGINPYGKSGGLQTLPVPGAKKVGRFDVKVK